MSKPTKEECQAWTDRLADLLGGGRDLPPATYQALLGWLERVRAALPSAAAVQADQDRREAERGQAGSK